MAEATKSVLLVDYDSIHRSLAAGDSAAVGRLSSRLSAWIGAIEAGSMFAARPEAPTRRRVLIRRCYADPAVLANDRAAFLANGFQVIDCPPAEGREHNTAAIQMVLDSIDALDHPTGYEEFILLSADSDLSPLLIRLRAHNRMTAIYATLETADSYRAIADAIVEEPRFIAALLSEDEPDSEKTDEEEEARPPANRSEIEALARKVSSATNVPLFAPRTFAELFRHLVDEIGENGYHFQTTAENVASRMANAGRNVSRRQVIFVVKGLALKGHVFSTGDTPERLADVFREQVLYLAENAGLPLDNDERRVLSSWIVGQVQSAAETARSGEIRKASSQPSSDGDGTTKSGNDQSVRSSRRKPLSRSTASGKPSDDVKSTEPPKTAATATKPSEPQKAATSAAKPSEPSKPAAPSRQEATTSKPTAVTEQEAAPPSKPAATASDSTTRSTASQTAAATPAPREKPAASSGTAAATSPAPSRPTAPSVKPASSPPKPDGGEDKDAVESSILAAIAQAVDVLVEDSGGRSRASVEPDEVEPGPAEEAAAETDAEAEAEQVPEGDDIGDEIQRIIASYSRNRNKDNK